MKKKILAVTLATVMSVGLFGAFNTQAADTIKIGYINITSDNSVSDTDVQSAIDKITQKVSDQGGIEVNGEAKQIEISFTSCAAEKAEAIATQELTDENAVDMIIAVGSDEDTNIVSQVAETNGIPCITMPTVADTVDLNFTKKTDCEWTFNAGWTIENIYDCYKNMWITAGFNPGEGHMVGLAFSSDDEGTAWHDTFASMLPEDGYISIDAGQYTDDYSGLITAFKMENVDMLVVTNNISDFKNIYKACVDEGVEIKCASSSKYCFLITNETEETTEEPTEESTDASIESIITDDLWNEDDVMAEEITEINSDENINAMSLAESYVYYGFELAADAFTKAASIDHETVRDTLANTSTETVIGAVAIE